MKINTTPGETYIVLSTGGCTVTTGAGKQIKKLAAGQDFFTAMTGDSIISDDNASVTVAKGEILSMLNTDGTGSDVQATLRFQPVTSQSALPATGENGVIYLVPNGAGAPNQYTEWVWTGAAYEQLGDVGVDLGGGAGTLGVYNVVTTGGVVTTNRIKLVSDMPTLDSADTMPGAEICGASTYDNSGNTYNTIDIKTGGVSLFSSSGYPAWLNTPVLRTDEVSGLQRVVPADRMDIGGNMCILTDTSAGSTVQTTLILGGYASWSNQGIRYTHTTGDQEKKDVLYFGQYSMLNLGYYGELRCGNSDEGIRMYTDVSGVATLYIGSQAKVIGLADSGGSGSAGVDTLSADTLVVNTIMSLDSHTRNVISFENTHITNVASLAVEDDNGYVCTSRLKSQNGFIYVPEFRGSEETDWRVRVSGVLELTGSGGLVLKENTGISGPGWDAMVQQIQAGSSSGSGGGNIATLTAGELNVNNIKFTSAVGSYAGGGISFNNSNLTEINSLGADAIYTNKIQVDGGYKRKVFIGNPDGNGTSVFALYLDEGVHITGPGWEEMQASIATAVAAESEQESFTKLIFPPTGTATAEQDPSWITKKNILMETSGGQLNMTHLTETLAYAAQNRFDIAKRTLWLSTSPGSGDAVQWPANAVFPDDQPQDKIQQLNSNSTYWFDITYVGGSDTVLIRKVCSWASTTGENGPTD